MTSSGPRNPPPRFYTPRNEHRETRGREVGKVLRVIDGPPMWWQQHVFDVAAEIDPATGLSWYREVIVVVLRQAGKTSMSRAKVTHRCLTEPGASVLYTAQDRNKSLRRLQKSFYEPIDRSPLGVALARPRWSNGSEAVRFKNRSEIFIDAPTSKTGIHGDTLPEAHIDEAFAHHDARIEQGVNPTMVTVKGAQKWVTSAAGDTDSTYLWGKVEAGRARALAGTQGRIAYFEWSAPYDVDRADPETWLNTHPAIGYTIDLETMQAEFDSMVPEEFDRAYLGWWPRAAARPWVIPQASWSDCAVEDEDDVEWTGTPMWALDASPDREWASVGMAAGIPGARAWLELLQRARGLEWPVRYLRKLRDAFGGNVVVVDGSGPAAALAPDLEREGFEVRRLSLREKVDACGALYDDVLATNVRHGAQPELAAALEAANKRRSGDAFVWGRIQSADDISALYTLTLARFAWVEAQTRVYDVLASVH